MKKKNIHLIMVISICSIIFFNVQKTKAQSSKTNWKLVWSDEFDHNGLPDPTKWSFEDGYIHDGLKQYYTKNRLENARVKDGFLIITARKDNYRNEYFKQNNRLPAKISQKFSNMSGDSLPAYIKAQYDSIAHYTSASIISKGKFETQYGRIEMRAKMPRGLGAFPAFWMLGSNIDKIGWPKCGEIDIMEFLGNDPNKIYGTAIFADPNSGKYVKKQSAIYNTQLSSGFHAYAVEWDEHTVSFFFDNKKYSTVNTDQLSTGSYNPFRHPFYILLNFALGGSWAGPVDDNALPQEYIIDYVRVYK